MPRHHEHEHQMARLVRLRERSQALLDHTRELSAMARRTLRAAHLAQQCQPLQEIERQVLRELVRRHALDEPPQSRT